MDAEPDALVEQARAAVLELTREADRKQDEAGSGRRLVLQPRLDGAGGRFYGEEDAYGFAILDAATAPRPEQHDAGRARADNLQAWLHHACPDHGHGAEPEQDPEGLPDSAGARIAAGRDVVPPKLLVRIDLASLLHDRQVPAEVLTRLVGGRLWLTYSVVRQVVDRAGAQIRAVVVDDGEVVGVGRATRVPPGWLSDAVHAVHDTCTGPLCDRPALTADLDHATPWTPHDDPGGPTDVDNLGPLCAGTNRDRAATGWRPTQHTRGLRTWRHERTGLRTTSVPSTWRPPGHRRSSRGSPAHRPPGAPLPPSDDPLPF